MANPWRATQFAKADHNGIRAAAAILRAGGLVGFPTETVYGLGADAASSQAVASIYEAKQRPQFNPLIAHVSSFEDAREQGFFNEIATTLAQTFWPGPLTLVVPVSTHCTVCLLARAGLDSIALRVPAHPIALALLQACNGPLAAPSANPSGGVSPTAAQHVADGLDGRIDMILDGGPCTIGVESTIVRCTDEQPVLLRPGGISVSDIERVLKRPVLRTAAMAVADAQQPLAPGMLASHYAPNAKVRLRASNFFENEAVLDFAGQLRAFAAPGTIYRDLSPAGDLREAAANLFSFLRELDGAGAGQIAVAAIPQAGLGEAINDRLARAAADR